MPMNSDTVTITLPSPIYRSVKHQSRLRHRSIAEELVAAVTDYARQYALADGIEQEWAQLDAFTERELWHAAQIHVSSEHTEQFPDDAKATMNGHTQTGRMRTYDNR